MASEKRQVNFSDAERLAKSLGLAGAVETSAKEGSATLYEAFFIAVVNAIDLKESERLQQTGSSFHSSHQDSRGSSSHRSSGAG